MASSDLADIPAGYFSTFSIIDPNNPTPENLTRTQKRNRRVFVCIPCHRRKLRCDKLQPCSRCVVAGIPDDCAYQPPPSSSSSSSRRASNKSSESKNLKEINNTGQKVKKEPSPEPSSSTIASPASASPSTLSHFSQWPIGDSKPSGTATLAADERFTTDATGLLGIESTGAEQEQHEPSTQRGFRSSILNGATHWTRIACEFEDAVPFLLGTDVQWQQRYRQVKSLKCLFPSMNDNVNFPFSSTGLHTKAQILSSLPPDHVIDSLISSYMETFGSTHCLFHAVQLQDEIQKFREAPADICDVWLAQLCMILALGAETASDFLFSGSGRSASEYASIFLNAAQASFGRSAYMMTPTLTTIRTLCLMVVAKLVEIPASGGSSSGSGRTSSSNSSGGYAPLVSLMAFTLRMAMSLRLHRSVSASSTDTAVAEGGANRTDAWEAEMRRRIWVTVRLLELDTAMRTGTSLLDIDSDVELPKPIHARIFCRLYPEGHDEPSRFGEVLCNDEGYSYLTTDTHGRNDTEYNNLANDADFHNDSDGLYQQRVAGFLPLLARVVNATNSPTRPEPSYEQIRVWSAQVRNWLRGNKQTLLYSWSSHEPEVQFAPGWGEQKVLENNRTQRAMTQYQFLEVLSHRALLALHHIPFCSSLPATSTEAGASELAHKIAQGMVVESSLALLSLQKTWATSSAELNSRCPSTCTNMTTATAASVDTPFSMLQPAASIKATAAEMIITPSVPLSGRSSPTMLGSSSEAMVGTATSMRTGGWFLDLCHDDFAAALMYMVLVLRAAQQQDGAGADDSIRCNRSDRSGSAQHAFPNSDILGGNETAAVTAVRHGYQIMRDRSYRSVAHFKEFLGIAILYACFRGLHSGDMLSQVVDATNDVEQVVMSGRRYLLWAADSFAPDEAMMELNAPLLAYAGM